jgi:hypothetical protein
VNVLLSLNGSGVAPPDEEPALFGYAVNRDDPPLGVTQPREVIEIGILVETGFFPMLHAGVGMQQDDPAGSLFRGGDAWRRDVC